MMNVHHASLFPDLLGAAQYCNVLVAQDAIALRQAEVAQNEEPKLAPVEAQREVAAAPAAAEQQKRSMREVLAQPAEASGVEPARLALIADELATELSKQQFVDWEKRESVKAAMRNSARVVLRRLGYPAAARETVLDHLLGVMTPARSDGARDD